MDQPKKKSNLRWLVLFGFSGTVDMIQLFVSLTGIGIIVSEAMEVAMGPALIGLFALFKIPIFTKPRRIASLLGVALGDAITGGIAPFWVIDVWYIYHDVKKEERAENSMSAQRNAATNDIRQPLYQNGIRRSFAERASSGALPQNINRDGIRPPNGGLR